MPSNPGGVTALMIAAGEQSCRVVAEVLLKSGADVNARSEDGRTALGIAQSKNNEPWCKLLQDASQQGAGSATG